jgi:hypothetical protein
MRAALQTVVDGAATEEGVWHIDASLCPRQAAVAMVLRRDGDQVYALGYAREKDGVEGVALPIEMVRKSESPRMAAARMVYAATGLALHDAYDAVLPYPLLVADGSSGEDVAALLSRGADLRDVCETFVHAAILDRDTPTVADTRWMPLTHLVCGGHPLGARVAAVVTDLAAYIVGALPSEAQPERARLRSLALLTTTLHGMFLARSFPMAPACDSEMSCMSGFSAADADEEDVHGT